MSSQVLQFNTRVEIGRAGDVPVFASYDFARYLESQRVRTGGDVAPSNTDLAEQVSGATSSAGGANTAAGAAQATADSLKLPQYLTLAASATLTNERVLTQGENLTFTDAGAGGALTVALARNPSLKDSTGATLVQVASGALGLFGVAPIARPTTSTGAASFAANVGAAINSASTFDGYTLGQVVRALREIGILT